ncbi:hypothetical protein DMUE_1943 [Dictyocoela muelleri]|nr:hypothetical protein DMUE_1943 [Dictyocoela muelleri]
MTAHKYQNRLNSIKQRDFYTIRAYIRQIEDTVERLALCLDWCESIKIEKTQKIFYFGLDESVKFELTKLPQRDYQSIITTMRDMEFFLIEKLCRESETQRENQNEWNDKNQTCTRNSNKYNDRSHKKYCIYHKTKSHNSSECRSIRKQNPDTEKHKSPNNDKAFNINEIRPQPKIIEIPMNFEGKNYDALVDKGSVENYLP